MALTETQPESLGHMKLCTKLLLGFFLLVLMTAGAGGAGLFYIEKIRQEAVTLSKAASPKVDTTSEMAKQKKNAPITSLKRLNARVGQARLGLGVIMVVGLSLGLWYAAFVVRSISKPLSQLTGMVKDMTEGNLTARIDVKSTDEIGDLARCLNTFTERLQTSMREIIGNAATLNTASGQLSAVSEEMLHSTSSMSDKFTTVTSTSKDMSGSMVTVSAAFDQAMSNVRTVATSTEEMTSTVSEIAQNAEKSRQVTTVAVQNVTSASARVDELNTAAQEINKVTDVIMEIAEQTKLLALNATIEAARAGEAGKGFAVVANEVKELAQQTNAATEDIRAKIDAMRQSSHSTVQEIGQIRTVVTEVNDLVTSIASAVEEQAVTTRDIASNTAQTATGLQDSIHTVTQAADTSEFITADMSKLNQTSTELETISARLKDEATALGTVGHDLQKTIAWFKV